MIPDLEAALDRGLALVAAGGELVVLPTYTAMLELARSRSPAVSCGRTGRSAREDRRRAPLPRLPQHLRRPRQHRRPRPSRRPARPRARGPGVEPGDPLDPSAFDLLYVGGGQDREQALIAPDLAREAARCAEAVDGGAALLAVCGGYQLLGRGYRGRDGSWMPGAGFLPLETVAGERRHDR